MTMHAAMIVAIWTPWLISSEPCTENQCPTPSVVTVPFVVEAASQGESAAGGNAGTVRVILSGEFG
jgi:hypothetical protein